MPQGIEQAVEHYIICHYLPYEHETILMYISWGLPRPWFTARVNSLFIFYEGISPPKKLHDFHCEPVFRQETNIQAFLGIGVSYLSPFIWRSWSAQLMYPSHMTSGCSFTSCVSRRGCYNPKQYGWVISSHLSSYFWYGSMFGDECFIQRFSCTFVRKLHRDFREIWWCPRFKWGRSPTRGGKWYQYGIWVDSPVGDLYKIACWKMDPERCSDAGFLSAMVLEAMMWRDWWRISSKLTQTFEEIGVFKYYYTVIYIMI